MNKACFYQLMMAGIQIELPPCSDFS